MVVVSQIDRTSNYGHSVSKLRPIIDRITLRAANVLGRIIKRPSESLLTQLASADRTNPRPSRPESPLVAASHHIQLGQSAFDSGAFGEALHHFGEALKLAPEAPWAWHGRGDALQLSGQFEAALSAYDQAIAFDSSCGLHYAGRANALSALDQKEAAERAWKNALERDPTLTWMREGSKKP